MRRRSANSVIRAAITIAILWFFWSWLSGDPVLLKAGATATPPQCPANLPCDHLRPRLVVNGHVILTHQLLSGIAIATAVLLYSRRRLRHLTYGPLRLAEVTLQPVGDAASTASATAGVTALIMECLRVRDVTPQGVTPSYSGIDARSSDLQGSPAFPAPANLLTRTLTALAQSSVVDQGFSATVTQTPAQLPYTVGLTFSIQRVATGTVELVETCWASSLQEGARKVGFRLVAWQEESMRRRWPRRGPTVTPNASSMRLQYSALIEGWHRRYDGAVHFARAGLRVDPGNVALRLHLGQTYERLGLGLDAMIVYASGLIGLDDVRNGWRDRPRDDDLEPGHTSEALRTIQGTAWTERRPRRPKHRDADSAGLLWRYIANLGMSERWVDLLIAETTRVDDVFRNPDTTAGNHPWFSPRPHDGWPDMPSSPVDITWAVADARERSGLVRGFLAKRYHDTLAQRFPLLNEAWFQERRPREQPFEDVAPSAGPTIRELLGQARDLLPPTTGWQPDPRPPVSRDGQVSDLVAAIRHLIALHYLAWMDLPDHLQRHDAVAALYEGTRRCFSSALHYVITVDPAPVQGPESQPPHTLPEGDADRLRAEQAVLAAMLPGEAASWSAWRLNRPLVIACVSRLTAQLSAVHRYVVETYMADGRPASPPTLLDDLMHEHSDLFGRVAASLDLQLVLTTCAMRDLEDLVCGRAETPPLGDVRRSRLLWTMAQHRYCARLLYLERANGFVHAHSARTDPAFLATADELILQAHRRIEAILASPVPTWLRPVVTAVSSRLPWRRAVLSHDDDEWSQAYYAACAYAVTIPDYPGSIDGEASPLRGADDQEPNLAVDNNYHLWCRRYDAAAKLAIHHLDEAVLRRARSAHAGRSRGVADWILDEDPDLDLLRRHPRFRRWAAQRFQVTVLSDWRSPAFRALRSRTFQRSVTVAEVPDADRFKPRALLFREQCALGVLGTSVPWNRSQVRWGLTHTHYLVHGLFATVPAVIEQLRATASGVHAGQLTLAKTADDLVRFWSSVPLYKAMNASPELRLELGILLRRNGNLEHTLWPQFPREADVLLEARYLDFAAFTQKLAHRAPQGLESALTLQRLADGDGRSTYPDAAATALRACAHHLAGLLSDVEASLASPPSRRSLRRSPAGIG